MLLGGAARLLFLALFLKEVLEMRKFAASMSLVLAVFGVVIAGYPDIASADKPTYARVRPVDYWLFGAFVDHAYVCYKGSRERCFANYGGNTGGSKLDGTSGESDTDHVSCVHDEGKYKDGACYQEERKDAVCHQESNIGLADAGKTVNKARGYIASYKLFGTYGKSSRVLGCLKKCLAK